MSTRKGLVVFQRGLSVEILQMKLISLGGHFGNYFRYLRRKTRKSPFYSVLWPPIIKWLLKTMHLIL